ncbi:MAG TPA: phosphoglucomutase/phosphomannomutase family protein [Pyrinomonadaceae bacterium]|nr:phosphoglucomutase/phosphomannomutase family protein [Pyrinomonadaceae bacterium]
MGNAPPIKFGTDGWRAVIAREFTFANVERVAQAYADFLRKSEDSEALVIVGFDRRFLSEQFAQRAAEVLAGNGFRVALFQQSMPTPLVSWAVKDLQACGGVVITASHNPAEFNGFKIKAPWGGSAAPETTSAVERLVDFCSPKHAEIAGDSKEFLAPSVESYRRQIAGYIDLELLRSANQIVIVDPMHGSGALWVESFLKGGNLNVETIRAYRDPLFGGVNPEPIDQNLGPLKRRVMETNALVGLATDGDADRVGAVNELGETMTMHDVVPLVLLHLVRHRKTSGGIVRTFSQSVLLKRISAAHGLKVYETPIGFKYIAELMLKEDILIGAEESGGIGVKGHIPERDGILNSLLFLEAIVTAKKMPSEMLRDLHREFGEFHFGRRDLKMEVASGMALVADLATKPPGTVARSAVSSVETLDGTKLVFDDESWLLFRQSGTEPVLRVYSEATSREKMSRLLEEGERISLGLRG